MPKPLRLTPPENRDTDRSSAEHASLRKRVERRLTIRLRNDRDVLRYMIQTTAICVAAALLVDIANQLVFFESWSAAIRSWAITVSVVMVIALPVTRVIAKANLALYRLSRTDPLTGLLNRRAFFDDVDIGPSFIALIIFDIDRFKLVNDAHGHMIGDEVLRAVSAMMVSCLGASGRIARLGGEEFGLLASEPHQLTIRADLERFRDTVASTPVIAGSVAVSVTISAGLANRVGDQPLDDLYARADRALYEAKAAGRNRIVLADDRDGMRPPPPGAGVKWASGTQI